MTKTNKEVTIMPAMDGTGPMGQGPMTGGGFGRCNPNTDPAAYGGRGMGRGMGRGRVNRRYARRNMFAANNQQAEYTEFKQQDDVGQNEAIEELSRAVEELKAENEKLKEQLRRDKEK